jgi:hypothetical protein
MSLITTANAREMAGRHANALAAKEAGTDQHNFRNLVPL